MEKITRGEDGRLYYGKECVDVEEAYLRFRNDYHATLGRVASYRLDRAGRRTERVHGFGFCFEHPVRYPFVARTKYRMLGLLDVCYCRIIGCWDYRWVDDEHFEQWFDAAFSRHSGMLKSVGLKQKTGRTSSLYKKKKKKCQSIKTS